jgi:probable rRNA maturation factor
VQVEVCVQDYYAQAKSPLREGESSGLCEQTWQDYFQAWLLMLQPDSPIQGYELSLRLTDDAEIQSLNRVYRHQDRPTDVLAFAALEVKAPQPPADPIYLGDLVISVETAQRQAQEQQHTLQQELTWLAVHGLLHLLGWDHPDEVSLQQMLQEQDRLMVAVDPSWQPKFF